MPSQGCAAAAAPQQDLPHRDECPFCRATVSAAAVVCSGCGAQRSSRGARFPIAGLFLWCTLFGTIWVVGGALAVGPWLVKDADFRQGSQQRCVQHARIEQKPAPGMTLPSEPAALDIADTPCSEVVRLQERVASAVAAQRSANPDFLYRIYGVPRTVSSIRPATDSERRVWQLQRLGLSLGGLLLLSFGTVIGGRVWRWAFGRATDPVWVR